MKEIQVLDCTLRDGGYCNEWKFGLENAQRIVCGLVRANVDIIECGFLNKSINYNPDITKFSDVKELEHIIPDNRSNKLFVAMVNYGEYSAEDLAKNDGRNIDGVRIAFHKNDIDGALSLCRKIKDKGYLVFVQPMVSMSYTDEEFLNLIRKVNSIQPYAFYIVDSFGMMNEKNLMRLFYMVEHNLDDNIWIGFHSHNNMQLAYSNAQKLVMAQTNHRLIVDASIMGMGRGAGNLNSELFLGYLNENFCSRYEISPLLHIIDNILSAFYEKKYWGYSLPNYISATHNAHPNYASYLDSKKTLTYEDMNNIFDMMDDEKKASYDKEYIETLYIKYQEKDSVQESRLADFKQRLKDKIVLIIAPGLSSDIERKKIVSVANDKEVVTISINFDYDNNLTDYLFISNQRRYQNISKENRPKSIVTSNIPADDVYLQVRYKDLLNTYETVNDNAGLMLISLLVKMGVKKILIAGLDGYSVVSDENYADQRMNFHTERGLAEKKNKGIQNYLKEIRKLVDISFVTTPKYIIM